MIKFWFLLGQMEKLCYAEVDKGAHYAIIYTNNVQP